MPPLLTVMILKLGENQFSDVPASLSPSGLAPDYAAYGRHMRKKFLEKLRALCEAYANSIKRGHNKIHIWSSKPRRCICAASTEHEETDGR